MFRSHSSLSQHDLQRYVPHFPGLPHIQSRDDNPVPPNPQTAGLFGRVAIRSSLANCRETSGDERESDRRAEYMKDNSKCSGGKRKRFPGRTAMEPETKQLVKSLEEQQKKPQ